MIFFSVVPKSRLRIAAESGAGDVVADGLLLLGTFAFLFPPLTASAYDLNGAIAAAVGMVVVKDFVAESLLCETCRSSSLSLRMISLLMRISMRRS